MFVRLWQVGGGEDQLRLCASASVLDAVPGFWPPSEPGGDRTSTATPPTSSSLSWPAAEDRRTLAAVSDGAAHHRNEAPRGTGMLPADLTPDQLASAPTMASVDVLLIDDLTDDQDDAFAAAVHE